MKKAPGGRANPDTILLENGRLQGSSQDLFPSSFSGKKDQVKNTHRIILPGILFLLVLFSENLPPAIAAGDPLPPASTPSPPGQQTDPPFPAIHFAGKWLGGVKSGALIPVEGIDSRLTASSQDLPVNATLFYGLSDHFLLGMALDWFSFATNAPSGNTGSVVTIPLTPAGNIGSFSTIALTPSIEYRFTPLGQWSPYLTAGVGLNLNMYTPSSCPQGASSCKVSPQDALGGRIGGGSDWFITPRVALSMEIAYLFDATTLTTRTSTAGGSTTGYGVVNANTICLLFGVNFKTP